LRRLLLTALGDLEAVWADPALVDALIGLPVPAMELLLSCDELQVGKCWLSNFDIFAFFSSSLACISDSSNWQCLRSLQ